MGSWMTICVNLSSEPRPRGGPGTYTKFSNTSAGSRARPRATWRVKLTLLSKRDSPKTTRGRVLRAFEDAKLHIRGRAFEP